MELLGQVRRLQALTILLLVASISVLVYDRTRRRKEPPPLDAGAIDAAVDRALAARPSQVRPLEEKLGGLGARIESLERESRRETPAPPVRVVGIAERWLVRVRATAKGPRWKLLPLGPSESGPFPSGAEAADGWEPLTGEVARIELPAWRSPPPRGILLASAIVRTDNDAVEDAEAPQKLWLACDGELWDLAGQFFPLGRTASTLMRSSANTAAFPVTPASRLAIILDADALSRHATGVIDVYVRAGPLLAVEDGVHR